MEKIKITEQSGGMINFIVRPIRAYPLTFFIILACFFGWIQFIIAALGVDIVPDGMPLGPILAALIVTASMGKSELKQWGRQLKTLRARLSWYALALAAPIVIIITVVLANPALGTLLPTSAQLAAWTQIPVNFLAFLILVGIGEEAGWTAFVAPRLLRRNTFLTTWLILSAMRVLWHLPLMLHGNLSWVLGIGGNIAFQFIVLWLFQRSEVWFLAAIWHAMLNAVGGMFFFQMVQGADQARLGALMTAGYIIVAATIFLVDRRSLKRAPGLEPKRSTVINF